MPIEFPLTVHKPMRRIPQSPQQKQQDVPDDKEITFSAQQNNRGPLAFLLMKNYLSRNVTLEHIIYLGRPALRVVRNGGYFETRSHGHTYVELPLTTFYEGTISVDVAIVTNGRSNRSIPASAGLAFRMQPDDRYDLVCLCSASGLFNAMQPDDRLSVQYISSPSWTPEKLRLEQPWRYEAATRILEVRWNRLRIDVRNQTFFVYVGPNSAPVIKAPLLGSPARGSVAYWVGDGTDAYFSGLIIREGNIFP